MFKKKFKIFIQNLGKLFTFSFGFLGLFGLIVLLGGWSYDSNGNLVSQNLININDYALQHNDRGTSVSVSNDNMLVITTNLGGNALYFDVSFDMNQTYTISFDTNIPLSDIYLSKYSYESADMQPIQTNGVSSGSYTFTPDANYDFIRFWFSQEKTYNFSSLMLNTGLTALPYEPYGTWYSQTNYNSLQSRYEDLEIEYQETYDQLQTLLDQLGNISFNIDDYSVSVGNTPTPISYDYTKTVDIPNKFNSIGYLDISSIYSTYISNSNNNTIYISTPVNNLLSFDMQFNFNTMPNTTIKTFLSLPNGNVNNFIFSSDDFNYKENWSLSNFVAVSQIATNFDLNDISYVDIMITYNNVGNTLSEIKLGSNNGYNTGFDNGYNKGLEAIDFWKNQFNQLKLDYNSAMSTIESLKNQVNQLNEQLDNTIGWKPFIFTMADTPFRVVSNILGFEVFGINLYKVLVGLITTLAILWLIRKLRK